MVSPNVCSGVLRLFCMAAFIIERPAAKSAVSSRGAVAFNHSSSNMVGRSRGDAEPYAVSPFSFTETPALATLPVSMRRNWLSLNSPTPPSTKSESVACRWSATSSREYPPGRRPLSST